MVGIKLESVIVTDRAMNVKLPQDGIYRIKIRHGMNNELISQEKVNGTEGDNILKVYTSTLDKSGYMIQLTDEFHNILGRIIRSRINGYIGNNIWFVCILLNWYN